MNILYGTEHRDKLKRPAITTLGVYDGLHLGHQLIMKTVVERAKATGFTPTVITFSPHPRQVLDPVGAPPLLQTFEQKMEGLQILGIEQVIVIEFTKELASTRAEEFTKQILLDYLDSREVYLGKGFVFGYRREGNIEKLRKFAEKYGFLTDEVPEVSLRGNRISSTAVRDLLLAGRVNLARRMLGRPYGVEGIVSEGRKLGRELHFPTANLQPVNAVLPANGVYVTLALVNNVWYRSVSNIGFRPTVTDERVRMVEAHLLDFDQNLYGKKVRLRFLHRIRDEKKFDSLAQLKAQIGADRDRALCYFRRRGVRSSLQYT